MYFLPQSSVRRNENQMIAQTVDQEVHETALCRTYIFTTMATPHTKWRKLELQFNLISPSTTQQDSHSKEGGCL